MESLIFVLIASFGFIAYLVFLAVVRGWIFCWLWLWFIVPIFHLPTFSIAQGVGIGLVVTFLTAYLSDVKDEYKISLSERFANGLLFNFCALAIGYVVHLFL